MEKRIESTVRGRVQLVMFRDFTKRYARRLGLVGFVKNNPDGTVRVIAEGSEEKLKLLIAHLGKGSLLSRVDHVEVEWSAPTGELSPFAIHF